LIVALSGENPANALGQKICMWPFLCPELSYKMEAGELRERERERERETERQRQRKRRRETKTKRAPSEFISHLNSQCKKSIWDRTYWCSYFEKI
jgi:hypothetical protein